MNPLLVRSRVRLGNEFDGRKYEMSSRREETYHIALQPSASWKLNAMSIPVRGSVHTMRVSEATSHLVTCHSCVGTCTLLPLKAMSVANCFKSRRSGGSSTTKVMVSDSRSPSYLALFISLLRSPRNQVKANRAALYLCKKEIWSLAETTDAEQKPVPRSTQSLLRSS
jgi:hypothetical protein